MAVGRLVLSDDASFDLLSLLLVIEREQDESETTTSLRHFFSHDNGVFNFTVLREVVLQMLLRGGESEASDEKLDLVLFSRLMERSG